MAVLNWLIYNGNSYPLGSGWVEKLTPPTNLVVAADEVSAIISWTDPYNWSTVRWVSSKIVRSTSWIPTSVSDWTVVATITTKNQYSVSWYTDRVLTAGTTYYYNVFAIWDNWTESWWAWASVVPLVEKIKAPTNIIAIAGNESASITWTDPNDWYSTIWSRSILVRNASRVPTSSSDWIVLVTETTRNQYSSVWYTDTWLTPWETYYYNVFAVWDNSIETWWTWTSVVPVVAYTIDFLLVWWGWGWWWTDNRLRPGWWGWAWWLIYCCWYEILQGATIPVTIWAWWTSTSYNSATKWGDSCFWSIVAYGWWPWQSYYWTYETCWWSGWWWDWARPGTWWECVDGQGHAWWNWASRWGWGWGWAGAAWCNAPWDGRSWGAWWAWLCFDISWQLCRYAWWGWWGNCTSWCWWAWWQGWWQKWWCWNATYYGWWGWWWGYCNTRNWAWYQWIFIARYPTDCWYGITWWTKYTCWNYTIHCFTSDWNLIIS